MFFLIKMIPGQSGFCGWVYRATDVIIHLQMSWKLDLFEEIAGDELEMALYKSYKNVTAKGKANLTFR